MDFIVPFITGLTTGGLSCLAVQGGLLAGSIAHEVEQSVKDRPALPLARPNAKRPYPAGPARPASKAATQASKPARPGAQPAGSRGQTGPWAQSSVRPLPAQAQAVIEPQDRAARPIVLFLSAKLVAYTILGFFLGLAGSVLQLSPMTRALLQAAIGVFMVGTALRMLNVHPIFRYFSLEPPRSVTRYIRRRSKDQAHALTPLFLGALTVLIPCGVTQAMMAVAMGTGNPLAGAVTMFAFILGTSPVFFAIAYLATRLGSRLEANFMRAVAVVVLVLGLISVDAGLTLAGWPYSFSNLRLAYSTAAAEAASASGQGQEAATGQTAVVYGQGEYLGPPSPRNSPSEGVSAPASDSSAGSGAAGSGNVVTIRVAGNGYSPRVSHAKPGQPLQMALVTRNTGGCARAFVIPALGVQKVLPGTGTTTIDVPAQKSGSKLYYSCSMGMYNGVVVFDG